MCSPNGTENHINDKLTSFPSVLSNRTTRPPRSPVARCSPLLSNSIAEMISTGERKGSR